MKKDIFICFFMIITNIIYSQDNDYERLIDSAITLKSKNICDKIYSKKNSDTHKNTLKKLISSIYLFDERDNTYFYENKQNPITFRVLKSCYRENRKELKKGINVWKIVPILKGDILIIRITDFIVKQPTKKEMIFIVKEGTFKVIFKYNNVKDLWEQVEVTY